MWGFQAARPLLERAVRDTYGVEMKEVFGNLDLAIARWAKLLEERTRLEQFQTETVAAADSAASH